jgi:hypothetical protein
MNMPATYVQYMSNSWSDTQALDRWTLISPVFATVVRIFRDNQIKLNYIKIILTSILEQLLFII